ncbi:MAG: hypothetical protein KDI71_01755 [Xanthomonadales bacterium]|nr:hypothetical protein [Xanthomonadales bacterium]
MSLQSGGPVAITSSTARGRSDSLIRRLRDWLTPAGAFAAIGQLARLHPEVALSVFQIDASTRQLLDPSCRRYAYQVLRERGFPNRAIRIDGNQLQWLPRLAALLLDPLSSARWLSAADRGSERASFAFLYQPFTLSLAGDCILSGRIVPRYSSAQLPWSSLQPSMVSGCLILESAEAAIPGGEDEQIARTLADLVAA